MKSPNPGRKAFTLMETVIAIGVVAVLLTGFIVVFGPAAQGIKKAINVQVADSLSSALERDLVELDRKAPYDSATSYPTGFDKAFDAIKNSDKADNAWIVYQYRAQPPSSGNQDAFIGSLSGKLAGKDYFVKAVARRKDDSRVADELKAVEGAAYLVKMTQLVTGTSGLEPGTAGTIRDPKSGGAAANTANDYPEAVIAFTAEFHPLPSSKDTFVAGAGFGTAFSKAKTPTFSRNMAVRR